MFDNIPKHFCQRLAIVIQFEFLLGTKVSSKYFVAILKWFYSIKFKVSTISFPQKYILKFTAITITGLSEPDGHWLSKSFGRSANPISTRGTVMPTTLQHAPPPLGFSDLPTALLKHIWALKVHALDSVS